MLYPLSYEGRRLPSLRYGIGSDGYRGRFQRNGAAFPHSEFNY